MVRLMLVLAPVMCILAGIGVSATLHTYMKNLDPLFEKKKTDAASTKKAAKKTQAELNYPIKNEVSQTTADHVFLLCISIHRVELICKPMLLNC